MPKATTLAQNTAEHLAGLVERVTFHNPERLRSGYQNALMRLATMKMQAAVRRARMMRPSLS